MIVKKFSNVIFSCKIIEFSGGDLHQTLSTSRKVISHGLDEGGTTRVSPSTGIVVEG